MEVGMPDPGDTIYELRVALDGVNPPVIPTLVVPADIGMVQLRVVLQLAIGRTNAHLHEFRQGHRRFALPDLDGDSFGAKAEDEADYLLCELLKRPKLRLAYEYDFGDGWEHTMTLVAVRPGRCRTPKVLNGERACPSEDCGGPGGYYDLLAIIANPDDPEHAERMEWLPSGFDSEVHNLAEVIEALAVVVEALVQQFEGLADWDFGEDLEGDPKVIEFPKGGPKGRRGPPAAGPSPSHPRSRADPARDTVAGHGITESAANVHADI
jgi:hypothetical protein